MEEALDQEEREDWLLQQTTQKVLARLRRELQTAQSRALGLLCTGALEEMRIVGAEIRVLERTLKLMKGESQ